MGDGGGVRVIAWQRGEIPCWVKEYDRPTARVALSRPAWVQAVFARTGAYRLQVARLCDCEVDLDG